MVTEESKLCFKTVSAAIVCKVDTVIKGISKERHSAFATESPILKTVDSEVYPSIRGMESCVWQAWSDKKFDDVGYCNPVYLKGLYKPN
jgi:hypothetical protein